jgi:putative nucleotidyltransferase with HDIG domain
MLYDGDHPAVERALARAWERIRELQETHPRGRFTLAGPEIVFQNRPLPELRRWAWGRRLADAGVQRIELLGPVGREDLEAFVQDLSALLGASRGTAQVRQTRPTNIRWGHAGFADSLAESEVSEEGLRLRGHTDLDLDAEAETVGWLHDELREGRGLKLLEAETLVRSLSVAMHAGQHYMVPLLRLKAFDQYTTTHSLNVSVLAMALAEFIGLEPGQVRTFGLAGLLHDLGKTTIPREILVKPGRLTESEREVMNRHTVEGARLILESDQQLDLAAVVAYEHHVKLDGGGYPSFRWPRSCHQASDLVHVCDVFDALRTRRPYREAWERERVLGYLEAGAGTEFDGELVRAFVTMLRSGAARTVELEAPDESLLPEEGESGEPVPEDGDEPPAS